MFPAVLSFSTRKPVFLLVIVCIAEVFSLLSFAAWPIYLVTLQTEWLLTNYQVGWISGAYFMGYVCATPFLVGITDRMDARHIYLFSAFLGGVGCLCFAVFELTSGQPAFHGRLLGLAWQELTCPACKF